MHIEPTQRDKSVGVPGMRVRPGDPDRCLKVLESVQGRLLKTLFTNCQRVRRDDKNLRGEMQRCPRRGAEKILYAGSRDLCSASRGSRKWKQEPDQENQSDRNTENQGPGG